MEQAEKPQIKIAIIGGGAAGMMCGIFCARNGANVTIFEKNEKLGKKLFITGKGRANITNDTSVEGIIDNTITNGKSVKTALYNFAPSAVMAFFEELGVPLKVERGGRVFPKSDKSSDILKALEKELKRQNVKIVLNHTVKSLDELGKFDKIVVATGGISYPQTGSTGDGYVFAKSLGHNIIKPVAALCPLVVNEGFITKNSGLSLKNVALNVDDVSGFGELLFTHNGLSGPIALSISSKINRRSFPLKGFLDLKPALSQEQLDNRLQRDFDENKNRQIKNIMGGLVPASLGEYVLKKAQISADKKICDITKTERILLAKTLKNMTFTTSKLDKIDLAIITAGGVDFKQINPRTMQSKLNPKVYFVGEVLDVDCLTGGYNLQVAFATGALVGNV